MSKLVQPPLRASTGHRSWSTKIYSRSRKSTIQFTFVGPWKLKEWKFKERNEKCTKTSRERLFMSWSWEATPRIAPKNDDEGGLDNIDDDVELIRQKNRKEQHENIKIIMEEFTAFEIICFGSILNISYCSSSPSSLSLNTVWFLKVRFLWSFQL